MGTIYEDMQIDMGGYHLYAQRISPSGDAKGITPDITLVFLHEGLGSAAQWKNFPSLLSEATGLPAFIYDRRGHGKSSPAVKTRTSEYMQEEALEVLPIVLQQAGISNPVFIGHSDGGTIALLYASAYPQQTVGVITEAAHVFVEDVTVTGIKETVNIFANDERFKASLEKYHGEKATQLFNAWADIWLSPSFRNWNIEECLNTMTSPLLIIQGANDEYATLRQVESIAGKTAGNAKRLIVASCGHSPHIAARESVLEAMSQFIKNNPNCRQHES